MTRPNVSLVEWAALIAIAIIAACALASPVSEFVHNATTAVATLLDGGTL